MLLLTLLVASLGPLPPYPPSQRRRGGELTRPVMSALLPVIRVYEGGHVELPPPRPPPDHMLLRLLPLLGVVPTHPPSRGKRGGEAPAKLAFNLHTPVRVYEGGNVELPPPIPAPDILTPRLLLLLPLTKRVLQITIMQVVRIHKNKMEGGSSVKISSKNYLKDRLS